MRLSAALLAVSLLGMIGGAWLIGTWAVGGAVMTDSLLLGLWVLFRDDGTGRREPDAAEPATLHAILERARRAS